MKPEVKEDGKKYLLGIIAFVIGTTIAAVAIPMIFFNPLKENKAPLKVSLREDKSNVQRQTNTDSITPNIDVTEATEKDISSTTSAENWQTEALIYAQSETNQIVKRISCNQYRAYNLRSNIDSLNRSNIIFVIPCDTGVIVNDPPVVVTNNLGRWELVKWNEKLVWIIQSALEK